MFKVLDLFSGIGGFSLGLERTGHFKTVAFCEIDNYCQRVLHKHWPGVYIHSDIKLLRKRVLDYHGCGTPDVLCGGFPCQDISNAGNKAGIEGERSGLWSEYFRLICELRPHYAIVENVSALLVRGMGRVLGDLASCGYSAEWDCIRAFDVGAPHLRDRVWIVAYPDRGGRGQSKVLCELAGRAEAVSVGEDVSDSERFGQQGPRVLINASYQATNREWETGHALDVRLASQWRVEPNVGRVANGVPSRVDRLKSLGNSIVPQIATWIGQRIVEAELLSSPATISTQLADESDVARKES